MWFMPIMLTLMSVRVFLHQGELARRALGATGAQMEEAVQVSPGTPN